MPIEYYSIQIYEVASISQSSQYILSADTFNSSVCDYSISGVRFRLIDSITKCEDMGMLLIESN